jgi:hypothetical protein
MTRRNLVLCALAFSCCLGPLHAADDGPYLGKVFLGIQSDRVQLPEDSRYESTWGLVITGIPAMSAAEAAGLRVGDIIASIDGSVWTDEQIRLSRSFGKAGDKARPGDVADFLVLRKDPADPDGEPSLQTIPVTLTRYPRTQPDEPRTPTNAELRPDLADARPACEEACWQLIEQAGWREPTEDLLRRLDRADQFPDPDRLPIVRYVLRDPFKLEAVAREAVETLRADQDASPESAALAAARRTLVTFDRRGTYPEVASGVEADYAGRDLAGHLEYVEQVLRAAAEHHERAFAALTAEEVKQIRDHRMELLDAFIDYKMLSYDRDREAQGRYLPLLDLAGRVDLDALMSQTRVLLELLSPEFLASLAQAAEASGQDLNAAVVAERKTQFGDIVVGGRGRARYGGREFAALFELGGDDVYANAQATSIWGSIPSALIVDFAGDDAFETHSAFSQGCGDMGVGILADLSGDDNYIGMKYTQGAGFCGVGMLIDGVGNDTYRGLQMHQGIGHWGVGALLDGGGDDRYEAHCCSQGVGLPGGMGIVHDLGDGADSYYCKGDQASGYGTAGVFEGWGQGVGFGYRPYASGGVGIALDEGGSDRMEAGNFSQGGGYFYGFGTLYSGGEEADRYIGSRWAQGFGCHQAAGCMIEEGGDDEYLTRYAVAQGIAWDEAVCLFIEQAGDDRYEGGGFSQGASAHNGFTIFLERQGDDSYLYTNQARAGGNDYHGGSSLSFFADLGGGADSYPSRSNDTTEFDGEHAIFVDTAEDSLPH